MPDPSPRAFATATGYVLQLVGLVFLLGSCCFWTFSNHIVEQPKEPVAHWTDHLRGEGLSAAGLTICAVVTLIGGIALVATGIGLHGELPASGRLAMIVTAMMAILYWTLAILLIASAKTWLYGAVPAVFALVTTVLFLLAGHSTTILRQFPPPADQNVATEEFLQQVREERAKRLKEFDP